MEGEKMKRSAFKWLLGISIAVLVFIAVNMVVFWALGNATGALASALMSIKSDSFAFNGITFFEFCSNFIGSPMFYVSIVAVISLITSIVLLIITRKNKRS